MHCRKNNLHFRIKTEPATEGADATEMPGLRAKQLCTNG